MGQTPWSAVINLSNSIIGVSVLAMPWCFNECGVVMAIALLCVTGVVNKFSCNLLLRSSKATRKTSYETLSHHTLGGMGKLAVEVSVILLLMCTCIAFFVIIGDLGPSLVSKFAGIENTSNLRTLILLGTAVFIILPLAQKRNVESLSGLSTLSICFYFFFATSVFIDSLPRLISMEWISTIVLWRPAGILKAMSIFALSMCCQPTLFAIYNSLQERTPKMMEDVVSKGVNLVAFVYMVIGFFGYLTYYQELGGVKGDVLLNQPPSMIADILKLFFALSVALSFPLVVFPCRSSIFSLLFPNADCNPITGMTYIPPTLFRVITVVILIITLTIAILVPNVEVVLSLTGATMGSLACFILPALIYQHTLGVPTRFMPKVLLIIGICFMLFSTYDNIRPAPQDNRIPAPAVQVIDKLDKIKVDELPVGDKFVERQDVAAVKSEEKMGLQGDDVIKEKEKEVDVGDIMAVKQDSGEEKAKSKGDDDTRQEPPIPHAPVDDARADVKDKDVEDILKVGEDKKEDKEEKAEGQLEEPEKKGEKDDAPEEREKKIGEEMKEKDGERDGRVIVDDGAAKKDSKEKEVDGETKEKFKVQEEKQEQQEKKLEELQARQVIQERLIIKQAEEIDQLKKEHEEDKKKDDEIVNAAAQLAQVQAAQQAMGQAQGQVAQHPVADGLQQQQQPAGPGMQPVQPLAGGGQAVVGQPVAGQVGDQLGQLGVQQQHQPLAAQVPVQPVIAGQLPVGQQGGGQNPVAGQVPLGQGGQVPVVQQAAGQLPLVQQPAGQLPVAQQPAGQLPVAQQPAQLPVAGQPVLGQAGAPVGQAAVQPLPGQQLAGLQQQQLLQQQPVAAGQPNVQVGMQQVAGMGQNVAVQQGGVLGGLPHAGVEGINQVAGMAGVLPQQQQQLLQGQQQQGVLLDGGMQAAVGGGGGGGEILGQANAIPQQQQFQGNVAQQNPLALQQQQQLLQQQQLVMQQQQLPQQQNQQPALQIVPDAGDALQGGQQLLPQQPQGVAGANDGVVLGGAGLEGGIPQQPQHLEPADQMIKSVDKDAILEPGKELNPAAGIQQRVLNQAENDGNKENEKEAKDGDGDGEKEGESDGVIQIVNEEEEAEEEGMGGGNGDAVPDLKEEEKGVAADDEKTGNQDDIRMEEERRGDREDGNDGDNHKKEEIKEGDDEQQLIDDADSQGNSIEGAEDKLLENHLKMIANKDEEEEIFADQEDVEDAGVAMVKEEEDDVGKIEMNQEQNDAQQEKKNIRSREEV